MSFCWLGWWRGYWNHTRLVPAPRSSPEIDWYSTLKWDPAGQDLTLTRDLGSPMSLRLPRRVQKRRRWQSLSCMHRSVDSNDLVVSWNCLTHSCIKSITLFEIHSTSAMLVNISRSLCKQQAPLSSGTTPWTTLEVRVETGDSISYSSTSSNTSLFPTCGKFLLFFHQECHSMRVMDFGHVKHVEVPSKYLGRMCCGWKFVDDAH